MSFVRIGVIFVALICLLSLSQAYGYYGQQSINSDYYFRDTYNSPVILYNDSPHWDYYSYNTYSPYPTLGGGLFFPRSGYSYAYAAPIVNYGYASPLYGGSYAYGAASDFSYRNSGYGCTGFFWC